MRSKRTVGKYLLQSGVLVAMGIQVETKLWGLGPGKVVKESLDQE
jgi:hypothetical protein